MGNPASIFQLIHDTLLQKENLLTVSELCKCGGVSRSGYYNWEKNAKRRQQQENADRQDFELVLEAYRYRGYKKGIRSIHMRLLHKGIVMNPKKIRRLMQKYNLFCPIRKANPYRRMRSTPAICSCRSSLPTIILKRSSASTGANFRSILWRRITNRSSIARLLMLCR